MNAVLLLYFALPKKTSFPSVIVMEGRDTSGFNKYMKNTNPFDGSKVNPTPLLQFIFPIFSILNWISIVFALTEDADFEIGVLLFCLGIGAFVGSIMNLKRGDPHGNVNLILSVILGFAGGITQIAGVMAKTGHIHFHPWIMSVILLFGGLYMLTFLPLYTDRPLYFWMSHLFVTMGFLFKSMGDLCGVHLLEVIGAWCLFGFAITGLYAGISNMYEQCGRQLPQGITFNQLMQKIE